MQTKSCADLLAPDAVSSDVVHWRLLKLTCLVCWGIKTIDEVLLPLEHHSLLLSVHHAQTQILVDWRGLKLLFACCCVV